jgi:hypothetical protein
MTRAMNPEKVKRSLYDDCALLARAVSERTSWPLALIQEDDDADNPVVWHVGVITPDRRFFDAAGPHDGYQYEPWQWPQEIPAEPIPYEVCADAADMLHACGFSDG